METRLQACVGDQASLWLTNTPVEFKSVLYQGTLPPSRYFFHAFTRHEGVEDGSAPCDTTLYIYVCVLIEE